MQAAGARFGPYEIRAPLGAGGMGEVYRARDTRLDRDVALKLLPAGVAPDGDKLRRFELEARAAGALNHPAVLGILDIGMQDGHPYVVSELLEGETLRERLVVSPLPVKKALDLAVQIAHGLSAAHDKGIVHRDLKPDNLFVTKDGRAKILDFGLAKLAPAAGENSETLSANDTPITQEGTVLGTVGYMSPEQVRGLPADARSDIFSFGAVLYEMVSGVRAFRRDTAAETMTAILRDDPPELAQSNAHVSEPIERIVRRCLEKTPSERFQSACDLAYAIEAVGLAGPARSSGEEKATRPAPTTVVASRRSWRWLAAGALAAAAFVVGSLVPGAAGPDLGRYRFTPMATERVYEDFPSWSPDGTTLAYVRDVEGVLQVFTRSPGASMAAQITQAPRDCRQPFWSTDGTRLYYVSQAADGESLWSVSAAGGTPRVVLKDVGAATLSPDGKALALLREDARQGSFFQSLWISAPPGAEPVRYGEEPLASRRIADSRFRYSPDGGVLALWLTSVGDDHGEAARRGAVEELWLIPSGGGGPRLVPVGDELSHPPDFSWMPDGRHLLIATSELRRTPGTHLWLMDTRDPRELVPVTATNGSETSPEVARDGRIAYTSRDEDYRLIEIPLDGSGTRSAHLAARMETDPAWSPKGGQYAFVTERSGEPEIWLRSPDGAFERPLVTAERFRDGRTSLIANLAFSPDGQRVAYERAANHGFGIWVSTVAGGPTVEIPSIPGATYNDFPTWSPDGDSLAFVYMKDGIYNLARVKAGGVERPTVIKEGIVYPSSPRWSPRGDWITCDTPDGFSIVSPDGKQTRLLSDETWMAHGWSRDGTIVYAIRETEELHLQLTSFDVASGAEKVINADLGPTPPTSTPLRGFSLAPDGRSFLTSIVELRGDIWMLDGFDTPGTLFARLKQKLTTAMAAGR
jgi:eukaryotic-like serine/threonine-protein kinase